MNENATYPLPRIKDLAVAERPQERQERHGPAVLTDAEQLAMLLRHGNAGRSVKCIAEELLAAAGGSLAGMLHWHAGDFRRVKGVGRVKAQQLVSVLEITRRLLAGRDVVTLPMNRPEMVARLLEPELLGLKVEKFWALSLNRRNRLLRSDAISSGTATSSLAHPREVFREAIKAGAVAVVAAHNHPSGDPTPSASDIAITRQLNEAARAIQIDLVDHIILGRRGADPNGRGYYSFRDAGLI